VEHDTRVTTGHDRNERTPEADGHGVRSPLPLDKPTPISGRVSQRFGLVAGTLGVCLERSC
ncbi:hypothetical protein, partial [Microbacterium paludicola]|uniref:hypothetical protein n=1 Tax=Microbacterium paludicola TaxID=300019 RepID=UPI001ADD8621